MAGGPIVRPVRYYAFVQLPRQTTALASLPLSGFDDQQAEALVFDVQAFYMWRERHGLTITSPETAAVMEQADRALIANENTVVAPPVARTVAPAHALRSDTEELRAFANACPWLSLRLRQVFELCIQRGLSLTACGEELGISRETVRVHLRRLRGFQRRYGMSTILPPAQR